jgi:hypothetical protein
MSRAASLFRAFALVFFAGSAACSGASEADAIVGGPRRLARGQITVRAILSNHDSIFWARETAPFTGDIVTARADGSGTPLAIGTYRTASPSTSATAAFVVNDEYVFWIRDGLLLRHLNSSTSVHGTSTTQAMGPCAGNALALDADYVYWAEWDVTISSLRILRQPIDGGIPTTLAFEASGSTGGGGSSTAVAVNDEFVYVGLSTGFRLASGFSPLAVRVPKHGGKLEALPIAPVALATDEDSIYWSQDTGSNPSVFSVDRRVPPADMLKAARLLGPGRTIAVGSTTVFGTNYGTVWQTPKSGGVRTEPLAGPPVSFVSMHGNALYLGVDDGLLSAGGAKLTAIEVLALE